MFNLDQNILSDMAADKIRGVLAYALPLILILISLLIISL